MLVPGGFCTHAGDVSFGSPEILRYDSASACDGCIREAISGPTRRWSPRAPGWQCTRQAGSASTNTHDRSLPASLPLARTPSTSPNARRGDLIIPCYFCTPAAKVGTLSATCAAGAAADMNEGPGSRWTQTQFIPPSKDTRWGPDLVDYAGVTAAQVSFEERRCSNGGLIHLRSSTTPPGLI